MMNNTTLKALREWLTLLIAVSGCVMGAIAFIEGRNAIELSTMLQTEAMLNEAWDIIGGDVVSDQITVISMTQDREKLVMARRLIAQVKKLEPENARAYSTESSYFYAMGMYQKALAAADEAIRLAPEKDSPYLKKSVVLIRLEEWDDALEAIERAISLAPDTSAYYSNKCVILRQLNRMDEAERACRRSIELGPMHLVTYRIFSSILRTNGKLDEARMVEEAGNKFDIRGGVLPDVGTDGPADQAQ